MPLFSIVIPVYGAEKYLPRCLNSVLAQTCPDWECLLIEDGSPDGSAAICDEYAAKDSRFRVYHQPNQGMGIALDNGIAAAKGTYLVTLDNDDMISPLLLENALSAQLTNEDAMVMWPYTSGDNLYREGPVQFSRIEKEQTARLFLDDRMFYRWSKLLRLDFIRENGFKTPNILYAQDTIFSMHYAAAWFKQKPHACYLMADHPLYFHDRSNPGSITAGYGKTYCADMLLQLSESPDWFTRDFPADEATQHELYHFHLRILGGCFWVESQHHGMEAAAKAIAHPAAQRIAAEARSMGLRSPFIRLILNKDVKKACILGEKVLKEGPSAYNKLCSRWHFLPFL